MTRLAAPAVALAVLVACMIAPVRQTSGDAAAGRLGALVLRCGGGFDLAHYDLVKFEVDHGRTPYYVHADERGELTSVFGPAPAVVGLLGVADVGTGDRVDDHALRVRARAVAAALVALAAALLVIAAAARVPWRRAALAGLVAGGSFAGAATLGQDLWQATVALPPLVGALAAFAWRARHPRANLATPALLVLAVMIRPTIAPLALALGIGWAIDARGWKTWAIAVALAAVAAAPLVAWNIAHLWSPLPIGQWRANQSMTEDVIAPSRFFVALAGLVVSPARGLVWFAPVALVGAWAGARGDRDQRIVALAIAAQVACMALFYKWHGGVAFGPRLVAEAVWLACWLVVDPKLPRALVAIAAAVTIAIGLLGLFRYDPDRWETRRGPDGHPGALWDVADSPLTALVVDRSGAHSDDSPLTRGFVCERGGIRALTAFDH
ncbi:MAG: hypothetical protein ACM31C_33710 [Acidobacteriota bacterium]